MLARLLIGLVRLYQLIRPPRPLPRCRFQPSCSAYAIEALRSNGALVGGAQAVWRLLRCGPWSRGGIDLVPPRVPRRRQVKVGG